MLIYCWLIRMSKEEREREMEEERERGRKRGVTAKRGRRDCYMLCAIPRSKRYADIFTIGLLRYSTSLGYF